MGKLLYGTPPTELEVEDRALAHLQVVVVNKFRRGECFAFSLPSSPADGTGRQTLWLHPTIPVQFSFYGSRMPAMNRTWIEQLMNEANSGRGLTLTPEPQQMTTTARTEAAA
jgi:hypothetical protein